ncbi:MAG TPA: hypothetical protein VKE40_03285 [Gemmataceae bacterium]|nr:hypothetical protein [Gemmataceae bacterium]
MYLGPPGLACPIGLGAAAACAALRAGVAGFEELPFHGRSRRPIIAARVPGVDLRQPRDGRLVDLLALALTDFLATAPELRAKDVPLLVGLAEPGRPGGADRLLPRIIPEVQAKLGVEFHPDQTRAIPEGHTAAFAALHVARDLLQSPDVPACVVCAVDSFVNPVSLTWLDDTWRLKREGHSNGVIPGEAAAAILVTRDPPANGVAVRVAGLGFGREDAHVLSDRPLLGFGLAEAARAALAEANVRMRDIHLRLSDVTGEAYGFKEQALSLSRLMREGPSDLPVWHWADAIGDCGAAAGVCMLAFARHAFLGSYAPGTRAMCYTSAVRGDRAVAVLERQLLRSVE